jgi:hypothetical protein
MIAAITSPLPSQVDADVPTKRSWFTGRKQEKKSVKWQIDETAPERKGPWKAPRRRGKPTVDNMNRCQSVPSISCWESSIDGTNDPTPVRPARRVSYMCEAKESVVSKTLEGSPRTTPKHRRRSSLLGGLSRWAGKNDASPAPPSRQKSLDKQVPRRRSLLGRMLENGSRNTLDCEPPRCKADATPSQPSRRQSSDSQGRRPSFLARVFQDYDFSSSSSGTFEGEKPE